MKQLWSLFLLIVLALNSATTALAQNAKKSGATTITICVGDTYKSTTVTAGFKGSGDEKPTVKSGDKAVATATLDTNGEHLSITGVAPGTTEVDVEVEAPSLRTGTNQETVTAKLIVNVIDCDFTTGDWFTPQSAVPPPKPVNPPPTPTPGTAHERPGSAKYKLADKGDSACYPSANAMAEYALAQSQFEIKMGHGDTSSDAGDKAHKAKANKSFDAFDEHVTAVDQTNADDAALIAKQLKTFQPGTRYFVEYPWHNGKASGSVYAIGGYVQGQGLTVMAIVTGTEPCEAAGDFATFLAIVEAKYTASVSGQDRFKQEGRMLVQQIRQVCCPAERVPTGGGARAVPGVPGTPRSPTPETRERTTTPPAPKTPPVDKDGTFKSILPSTQSATPDERAYLPDTAGPGSEIVATFIDPEQSGPSDVVIGIITDNGKTQYYQGRTDANHKLHFTLPTLLAGAAVVSVLLAKGFDATGKPDASAAITKIGTGLQVPNSDAVPNAPSSGLTIARGASAYEADPGRGVMHLQTSGTDPSSTRVLLDGKSNGVITRAASDQSVVAEIDPAAPPALGRHTVSVASNGATSNAFPTDVVSLKPHPLPPSQAGTIETLTVEVSGLGADAATMSFNIGGPATLTDGSTTTTVPVVNGIAKVSIRGTAPGAARVAFKLNVSIPGGPAR